MYIEPETFNMHIDYLKKHFKIVPFSRLFSYISDRSMLSKYPICVITFDDGWYDFYKNAYPILIAQKVPATVFLPTRFIGTCNRFWTDEVSNIFVQRNKYSENKRTKSTNVIVNKLTTLTGSTNNIIESAISILKNHGDDEILNILTELKNVIGVEDSISKRAFLNWEEVGKMAESGLVTFGSHTNNHKMLTYLDDNDIYEELTQSKNKLISENIVSPSFIPFSYPNGNYDKRVVKLVEEAGYHVAVTTENGWNHISNHRCTLNRVGIHQDISSTIEMFGSRIAGIF